MIRKFTFAAVSVCAPMIVNLAHAQRGTGDWMTAAYDPQRSSWVRSDAKISLSSMRKPGFGLYWAVKLESPARQLNTLMPPSLIDFYIGYKGFRTLGFFGGSADRVIAMDVDMGRVEWQKDYSGGAPAAGTLPCPGGMTSTVTRPTETAYPMPFAARGAGRNTPAKTGVGEPNEGAVTLANATGIRGARPRQAPPVAKPAPGAALDLTPFMPRVQYAVALTSDGKIHLVYISNGDEPSPAMQFLPANAHAKGLIVFNETAYAATSNGCGGVDNGVWALDLKAKKVSQWKSGGRGVAGIAGPAVRPDGTLFAAGGGGELVALDPQTLHVASSYKTGGAEFTSSPVIFEFNKKDLIAVTTNDGRLHVLDTAALGSGPLDSSAPFSGAGYSVGSLTSWQDAAGTRWVLVAASGSSAMNAGFRASNGEVKDGAIAAWKVVENEGKTKLEPGWVSRNLVSPFAPVVVNGVVFALSSGEFRSSDMSINAAERARRSTNAVLYALDPATGAEIWSSGSAMKSFVHTGGLAVGGGRVYASTYDGTQYAFAFPMER